MGLAPVLINLPFSVVQKEIFFKSSRGDLEWIMCGWRQRMEVKKRLGRMGEAVTQREPERGLTAVRVSAFVYLCADV